MSTLVPHLGPVLYLEWFFMFIRFAIRMKSQNPPVRQKNVILRTFEEKIAVLHIRKSRKVKNLKQVQINIFRKCLFKIHILYIYSFSCCIFFSFQKRLFSFLGFLTPSLSFVYIFFYNSFFIYLPHQLLYR